MLNVLYLAHDLSDPAIRRRVLMLKAGCAKVSVAGFLRDENRMAGDPQVPVVVLGTTADGRLGQRLGAVARARLRLAALLGGLARPDIIIARNLEMLALAGAVANRFGGAIPVVYECLDIHRLLLDRSPKGMVMRAAEGYFGRAAALLITSSPAFVENYFRPLSRLDLPVLLLENKVLQLEPAAETQRPAPRPPQPGAPWRIGWFGAIRCRKSFTILASFAAAMQGRVEVIIRGRVSPREFPDFEAMVAATPHIVFHGAYRNPEDLARIYDEVQFVWAIDFFEEGLNSQWLLPNRLYEGALHHAVPIALVSTETGRFLARNQLGLLLERADAPALQARFEALKPDDYAVLFSRLAATEPSWWLTGPGECWALVAHLAGLGKQAPVSRDFAIPSTLQSEG